MISVMPLRATERASAEALSVKPDQQEFVASNRASMQQADEQACCTPLGIHADGELVGFAMYALDPDDGNYWIYRVMIDQRFQGRGFGTAAVQAIIARMDALPGCTSIVLGVKPGNDAAARLYRRAGFRERGDRIDGEIVMVRTLEAVG